MKPLTRFKFYLHYFGFFKVALIGYLRPRLLKINDQELVVCLPLNRRSRNHLGSMYFGALAVGADIGGGLHAFYHAEKEQCNISLLFKSFQAQFLKRPEGKVYFVCNMGETIKEMIQESKKEQIRINKPIHVSAFTRYPDLTEPVAEFILELSVKVIQ